MKWGLLPYGESDYIFAIIGEELGFLGCLVVVALYGVLAYAGFRIARRSADRFVQLSSIAIATWLVGQAALNMGYVVGLLPVPGQAADPVRPRRRSSSAGRTVARVPGGGAERTARRGTAPRRRPVLDDRERGVPRRPVGARATEAATRRPGRPR